MKSGKTKLFHTLLPLLFLLLLLPACSTSGSTSGEVQEDTKVLDSTEELEHKLLSEWFDLLFATERWDADTLWAVSYVERFLEESTWDNLQRAKMAVSTAYSYVETREAPIENMEKEEYNALMQQGKDIGFVPVTFANLSMTQKNNLDFLMSISLSLEDDVFWKPSFSTLKENVFVHRAILETELSQLAATTDYLLLALETHDLIDRFRAFTEENCPLTAAYLDSTEQNTNTLYEKGTVIIDNLENLNHLLAGILGKMSRNLDDYKDLIIEKKWDALKENAVNIQGNYTVLPLPDWSGDNEMMFYWVDPDGNASIPESGDTIEKNPNRCVFTYSKATEDEFQRYINLLSQLGLEDLMQGEDQHGAYYDLGNSEILLSYGDEGARISMMENPVCLVPFWYYITL